MVVVKASPVNYEFIAHYLKQQLSRHGAGARVLDFGCGSGDLVALLREEGFEAYGTDLFIPEQGFISALEGTTTALANAGFIRPLRSDGQIPFESQSFDAVVSHMVIESTSSISIMPWRSSSASCSLRK